MGPGSLPPQTVLLTQTSLCLSRSPSQTLQDQTGTTERGMPPVGTERSILQMKFPSRGSPLPTQEEPRSSTRKGLLPAGSWNIIAGTASREHTLVVLSTPRPMQTQLVSITPYHSEPISTSSAALALPLFLGHADCHPTLQPAHGLQPDSLMTGPLLSFRSRLKYHLLREDFSDNPPPQSKVASSSQISPLIFNLIYI